MFSEYIEPIASIIRVIAIVSFLIVILITIKYTYEAQKKRSELNALESLDSEIKDIQSKLWNWKNIK